MNGIVLDILPGSLNDGPGIRTTVFLKGCPLRCKWCHNPESMEGQPQAFTNKEGAASIYGKTFSVEEVVARVIKDRPFFEESGGGVTLSGGEPLFQFEFTKTLLGAFKERGIHTCLDTTGFTTKERLAQLLPLVDLFHYDFKLGNSEAHKRWTGVPNETILENLKWLGSNGATIVLRCPIIPDVNDTKEHFDDIAHLFKTIEGIKKIDLLPYHHYHTYKWTQLGLPVPLLKESPADAEERYQKMLEKSLD